MSKRRLEVFHPLALHQFIIYPRVFVTLAIFQIVSVVTAVSKWAFASALVKVLTRDFS